MIFLSEIPAIPADADQTFHLHAGPAAANPPILLAVIVISTSLAAPVLFSLAGAPSLLLVIATLALALAGVITLLGAIAGQRRRWADVAIRHRASICTTGIIFYREPSITAPEVFPCRQIKQAWLTGNALILDTTQEHPKPGRHRLGFGKLAAPRNELVAAIAALNKAIEDAGREQNPS